MENYNENEEHNEGEEHELCYGLYYNENGDICEDGAQGLCSYCVECRRKCLFGD